MPERKPMTGKEIADFRAKAIEEMDRCIDRMTCGKEVVIIMAYVNDDGLLTRGRCGQGDTNFIATVLMRFLNDLRLELDLAFNDWISGIVRTLNEFASEKDKR